MEEGFDIPIGGDLTALQASFDSVLASFDRLGAQISASFEKTNAVITSSVAKLASLNAGTASVAASQNQAGTAISGLGSKLAATAKMAANFGHAATGLRDGLHVASRAAEMLRNTNLAASLTNWINRAGGVRAAFSQIPAAMAAIARNPTFRLIAVGAAAAVVSILTIRTAWRAVTAGANALGSAAAATFRGMVAAARSAAAAITASFRGIGSLPGKLMGSMGGALPIAGLVGGLGGIAGAMTLAFSSIEKAADMETLETAFAPLLGGADAAKARIQELAKVAAETPFELPEIARASRVLETLTRGALSTGAGLRMVGDVAAGTGAPFEELAMWVGRLYDGLQSGRPVGEALMRLQELGIVSGDVRSRIEALQKSGAAGDAVWAEAEAALGRFSGSMERQSKTWAGKLSTLRDNVNMLMAAFGTPIIDSLKPFLDMAITRIDTLKTAAVAMGNSIRTAFDGALAAWQTGNIAEVLGAGVTLAMIDGVNAFSSGVRGTVAYLGSALTSIMASIKESWGAQEFLGILMDLGKGLASMITSAILKAIDAIPGIDVTDDANREAASGANSFRRAGNRLEDFNGADAVQKSIEALRKAHEEGMKAFAEAGKSLLLDRGPAADKFAEVWKIVQERIDKNRAETEEAMRKLDEKLKNAKPGTPGGPLDLADKVTKSAAPAVMSLTRVGGGGFANTVMNNLFSEAKRQTGILKTIATNTAAKTSTAATYA